MRPRTGSIPECTHRPPCPGCPHYAQPGIATAALEQLRGFASETGARLEPTVDGDPVGHRHRARLMVRGRAQSPKIGLFQAQSHRIVDIPRCHVHHPLLNLAAAALKRAIRETASEPYAEGPHRGLVRAMQAVVERETQTLQLVVVTNSDEPASAEALIQALRAELGDRLHSLWWNGNPQRTNTILGDYWKQQLGPEAVCESIGGASVFFPPGAFGQSHLQLADEIVRRVHAAVPRPLRVAEFYAGCGAIGLGLLSRGHEVTFNELGAASLRGLELGLDALPISQRRQARVLPGAAGTRLSALADCDVVIVDPPRRGLDTALRDQLANDPPGRLLYLACDLERFLSDARALLAGHRLQLQSLTPFALFPFTEHVEVLGIFDPTDQTLKRKLITSPSRTT